MFGDIHFPHKISKVELDEYLAKGWYRMGQCIATTHIMQFESAFYAAIWLRVNIKQYQRENTHIKLLKKNKRFTVEIKPFRYDESLENVHAAYTQNIKFNLPDTLKESRDLITKSNIFDSQGIYLYDNDQVIAFGIFDIGEKSTAGILTEYNPLYAANTLGNYLKYLMIDYCKENHFEYFYPGYYIPGWKPFDYKLSIGKSALEYYHVLEKKWLPLEDRDAVFNPYHHLLLQLLQLQYVLANSYAIEAKLMQNLSFIAEFSHSAIGESLAHPIFLLLPNSLQYPNSEVLVVYQMFSKEYIITICNRVGANKIGDVAAMIPFTMERIFVLLDLY